MKFKCQACGKNRPCTIEIVGDGVPPKFCPYGNDQEQPAEWVVDIITNRDVINAMSNKQLARKFGYPCPPLPKKHCKGIDNIECTECWLNWLNAPAGKHQKVE